MTLSLAPHLVVAHGLPAIERAIGDACAALPALASGAATATNGLLFPTLLDEPGAGPPFDVPTWLHVLGAQTVAELGGAARFLAAPAPAELRADGAIWLRAYPDPLAYDTAAAVAGMRAVAAYLRTTRPA